MEFNAAKAREIMRNRDELVCERWYRRWKDSFFEKVSIAAMDGKDEIRVDSIKWRSDDRYFNYVKKMLEEVHKYKVTRVDNFMFVSWKE